MSDSTPTERFSAATSPIPTTPAGEPPQSRKLLLILASVGAALVLATLILLIVLLTRGDGENAASISTTSSATPTDSASPSVSASPSATPSASALDGDSDSDADTGGASDQPRFTSFSAPASVGGCSMGGPGADPFRPLVTVSWNSASAVSAWYVNGTSDAASAMFMEVPLAGDERDFEFDQYFPCSQETADFTITLVGDDGEHVSKTWTVENTGDVYS